MPLVQLANGPLSAAGPVEDEQLDDLENVPPIERSTNSGLKIFRASRFWNLNWLRTKRIRRPDWPNRGKGR